MSSSDVSSPDQDFDFLVFIGRFQPFHLGHQAVIQQALQQAHHVIVLIGSSHQPRTIRNPWHFAEREEQVLQSFSGAERKRITTLPLIDELYNDRNWVTRVQQSVNVIVSSYPPPIGRETPRIGLIGYAKDHTSYYLSLFPQWESVTTPEVKSLSSTPLRTAYFLDGQLPTESVPSAVLNLLKTFQTTSDYREVVAEWQFIKDYQSGWACAPYPPTFVTVDAVVVQSGHVLLVERRARPGIGQLALPGGFLNGQEKLRDAVIRELREETRIKVPAPVLAGSITRAEVFDSPYRSSRGRTITHGYLIELKPDANGLPKVKGGDDARRAFWLPLSELNPELMFEDHFHIIKSLIG